MTNVCKYCGKSFEDSKNKLFCSQSCSHAYSSSFVDHNKMKHAKCIQCGEDLYIKVPTGTIVKDLKSGNIIADLTQIPLAFSGY